MMSRPDLLASFLDWIPTQKAADEELELVIAGDFVDFLAVPPFAAWTADPVVATQKLQTTMNQEPFACVFDALGRLVERGHRMTVMLGNHDLEMALPQVQDALLTRIGASRRDVAFIDDGRAYRIGRVLIEHGNRYDDANENDWAGLRAISSALSRDEAPNRQLRVSVGSRIVEGLVNPLKPHYPFIDLLQPQGELLLFLLLAFEPRLLRSYWDKIALVWWGWISERRNKDGRQPGDTDMVDFRPTDQPDKDLLSAFGADYQDFRMPQNKVATGGWLPSVLKPGQDGLAALLDSNDRLPPERLRKIRVTLGKLLPDDPSGDWNGPTAQYGAAAERLSNGSGATRLVMMGHTHLARTAVSPGGISYINTGTWADVVRVPRRLLQDGPEADRELEAFLRDLKSGKRRQQVNTYGDVRVDADGENRSPRLMCFEGALL
jgi:UDP-2,3-diacylglucosamine pyrophosphatase LpxH